MCFQECFQTSNIFLGSFQENAILCGVSDTIVVKQKDKRYKSTPLLVCFGPYKTTHPQSLVKLEVNNIMIEQVYFQLDKKGYIYPKQLTDKQIKKLNLQFGVNKITYHLQNYSQTAQIYLYADNDKLVVSDVDGTVTINDIGGHLNNMINRNYLHPQYSNLANLIDKNGYKMVWLTMRALPLYQYSKNYLKQHCPVPGPILMEPQQFGNALINEVTKKTGNIKANMINMIGDLFNMNPFAGGLGNRENDAIAYNHGGMRLDQIFIIDTKSRVQQMHLGEHVISYQQILNNINNYFPPYSAPKVGYM